MDFLKIVVGVVLVLFGCIATSHTLQLCSPCQYYQFNKGLTTWCSPTECDEAGVNRLRCTASPTLLSFWYSLVGWSPTCPEGLVCCPTWFQEFCPSVTIPTSDIPIGKACYKPTSATIDCKVCQKPTCPMTGATSADYFCANTTATQDNCAAGLVCCENTKQLICAPPSPLYCD